MDSVSLRCAGAPLTRCAALLYKARGSYKSRHSDHEKAARTGGFSVTLRTAGEQFHFPAAHMGGFLVALRAAGEQFHLLAARMGGFSVALRAAGEQFHLPAAYVGGFRKVEWALPRKTIANGLTGTPEL